MGVPVDEIRLAAAGHFRRTGRPIVTLSYAQSLDGSLSAEPGAPLAISGPESLHLTHRLRAAHAAILVGIGTVLADDPQLTTRIVPGENPQRIVLDTNLRIPMESNLVRSDPAAWVFCAHGSDPARIGLLEAHDVRVFQLPRDPQNMLDLHALLDLLGQKGIQSLMVEGGRTVITSFLASGLVDHVVITIAPIFVGGQPSVDVLLDPFPRLEDAYFEKMGEDFIVYGAIGR